MAVKRIVGSGVIGRTGNDQGLPYNLLVINPADNSIALNSTATFGRASAGYVQDYAGTYTLIAAGYPRIQGARYSGNTPYYLLADGTPLHPTRVHNGATCLDNYPIRTAGTVYATNARVIPATNSGGTAGGDGYWYYASTGGTSHATIEPTWAAGPVSDGTAVWTRGGFYRIGGLLHEQQATSAMTYGSDLSVASWSKAAIGTASVPTVTASAGTAPDGGVSWRCQMDRGAGTTSGDRAYIGQNNDVQAAPWSWLAQVWMKSNDANTYTVVIRNSNSSTGQAVYSVTPTWTRHSLFLSSSPGGTDRVGLALVLRGDLTGQTADILVWCPMTVLGPDGASGLPSSSPILTTASAVTRAADSLTLPDASFSNSAGTLIADVQTEWTLAGGQLLGDGTEAVLSLFPANGGVKSNDGTTNVFGPPIKASGCQRVGIAWDTYSSTRVLGALGEITANQAYDGSFNLSSLIVGSSANMIIRNLRLYKVALSRSDLLAGVKRDTAGDKWLISSLFASGENGFWLNMFDWSKLYTDTAGTTLVTAVGQAIGKALDSSGNANHVTAPTDEARPVIQIDSSGNYYLFGDGSNDALIGASSNIIRNVGGATLISKAQARTTGTKVVVYVSRNSTGSTRVSHATDKAGGRRLDGDSNVQTTAGSTDTNINLFSGRINYASAWAEFYKNDVLVARTDPFQTSGNCSDTACNEFALFGSSSLGSFGNLNLYNSLIINRALTDQEMTYANAFLGGADSNEVYLLWDDGTTFPVWDVSGTPLIWD